MANIHNLLLSYGPVLCYTIILGTTHSVFLILLFWIIKTKVATFFEVAFPGLFFFIFVFSIQLTVNAQYNFLQMTGFEPRTSGVESDRSTNWVITTARKLQYLLRWHNTIVLCTSITDAIFREMDKPTRPIITINIC